MNIALTGATGFVGRRVLSRLLEVGHHVAALTRQPQAARNRVHWVPGALDTPFPLDALCRGADAIVHIAGVVNGADRSAFFAGNATGTANVVAAATRAGVGRFVHVSSLAAREETLSNYGASKAAAEAEVVGSSRDWRVVRPPAIYGPGDVDNLELFRMAARGFVPLPPPGRLSLLHVDDLARLIVALCESAQGHCSYDADDGRAGGWSHKEFAQAIGHAVGRRVTTVSLPAGLVRLGARVDRLARGDRARLTADRAAYFCHPDWVIDGDRRVPAAMWQPSIETNRGLATTAAWYREQGLLG